MTFEYAPQKEKPFMIFKHFLLVLLFSIAFAYIESSVVVYLREIFYPNGFEFPLAGFGLTPLWRKLLLIEIGREAATVVLMLTAARLMGRGLGQQFAFFMSIFAVWDIFYYVWLKVLIDWPGSIMDWDILFLIPAAWASPVLAPVIVSITMLVFSILILFRESIGKPINVNGMERLGFTAAALAVGVPFCIAGAHIKRSDYQYYFYWSLFVSGLLAAIVLFGKCWFNTPAKRPRAADIDGLM